MRVVTPVQVHGLIASAARARLAEKLACSPHRNDVPGLDVWDLGFAAALVSGRSDAAAALGRGRLEARQRVLAAAASVATMLSVRPSRAVGDRAGLVRVLGPHRRQITGLLARLDGQAQYRLEIGARACGAGSAVRVGPMQRRSAQAEALAGIRRLGLRLVEAAPAAGDALLRADVILDPLLVPWARDAVAAAFAPRQPS